MPFIIKGKVYHASKRSGEDHYEVHEVAGTAKLPRETAYLDAGWSTTWYGPFQTREEADAEVKALYRHSHKAANPNLHKNWPKLK